VVLVAAVMAEQTQQQEHQAQQTLAAVRVVVGLALQAVKAVLA